MTYVHLQAEVLGSAKSDFFDLTELLHIKTLNQWERPTSPEALLKK